MTEDSEHGSAACEEFQQRLPELAQTEEDLYRHSHLKTCAFCRSFVIDLERIANDAGKLGPEN